MINHITSGEFLERARTLPIIDVRSEKEHLQGHIPGAANLPLFNNEERAMVGTLYKNSGRKVSVLKGLEIVGLKLADFIKQLHKITDKKEILVHCWRGGLRSESMAWLFQLAGYEVSLLEGGYKAYRQFIRVQLSRPANIIVIGGLTGSGKTDLLRRLGQSGEQVLDLEKLACHKGSVFGGFGQPCQPTNEQFENDIFAAWEKLSLSRPVWIEDESRGIGNVAIPDPLFKQMDRAVMIKVEIAREIRIQRLVNEYSKVEKQDLCQAVQKIREKLGGTHTKTAITAIENGDYSTVADLALSYYDKTYTHSVKKRGNQSIYPLYIERDDPETNAALILETGKSIR